MKVVIEFTRAELKGMAEEAKDFIAHLHECQGSEGVDTEDGLSWKEYLRSKSLTYDAADWLGDQLEDMLRETSKEFADRLWQVLQRNFIAAVRGHEQQKFRTFKIVLR
ncbi:MAG: hypothetical protein ACYTFI_28760 [Planctomycetota bacterium]|jgi:hypothetical protein